MRSPAEALGLGILSVCVNIVLMLVKVATGLIGNSYALGAAAIIAVNAVAEIRTPHHAPEWFTLPVLIGVVVVKEMLSRRILSVGQEIGSTALRGDAWHHRSDAITSAAAVIGITVALIGGEGYEAADDWAALLACAIIVVNGFRILHSALHDVMDGSVPGEWHQAVVAAALATPGVEGTEKCRIRKSGTDQFVELHVRVDASISVYEGHRIGHRVKERVLSANPLVRDVVVHIEPSPNPVLHPGTDH